MELSIHGDYKPHLKDQNWRRSFLVVLGNYQFVRQQVRIVELVHHARISMASPSSLEDSSALWCGGIISPHCTIGSNWFGLKFEEKKESMLGFFNLNQYFVLIVFSTYFHFIHHIPKVNFQILYCALYLGTSPHPEIQSHPSVQSNPLIAPRCYIHLSMGLLCHGSPKRAIGTDFFELPNILKISQRTQKVIA